MRRLIAAGVVWLAAVALFVTINAQAKPGGIITPDVIGMTVAEAVAAWAEAGFLFVPSVQPGDLDPASVPDELVLGQDPESGSRQFADYPGVLYLEEEVEPSPSPGPTVSPTATATPAPEDDHDVVPAPDVEGDVTEVSGSLSFTH